MNIFIRFKLATKRIVKDLRQHPYKLYIPCTMTYGGIRKAIIMQNAEIEPYYEQKRPVLVTSKVAITMLSALTAVYLWPITLFCDIYNYEAKMRGIQVKEEKKRSEIDYLDFMG